MAKPLREIVPLSEARRPPGMTAAQWRSIETEASLSKPGSWAYQGSQEAEKVNQQIANIKRQREKAEARRQQIATEFAALAAKAKRAAETKRVAERQAAETKRVAERQAAETKRVAERQAELSKEIKTRQSQSLITQWMQARWSPAAAAQREIEAAKRSVNAELPKSGENWPKGTWDKSHWDKFSTGDWKNVKDAAKVKIKSMFGVHDPELAWPGIFKARDIETGRKDIVTAGKIAGYTALGIGAGLAALGDASGRGGGYPSARGRRPGARAFKVKAFPTYKEPRRTKFKMPKEPTYKAKVSKATKWREPPAPRFSRTIGTPQKMSGGTTVYTRSVGGKIRSATVNKQKVGNTTMVTSIGDAWSRSRNQDYKTRTGWIQRIGKLTSRGGKPGLFGR